MLIELHICIHLYMCLHVKVWLLITAHAVHWILITLNYLKCAPIVQPTAVDCYKGCFHLLPRKMLSSKRLVYFRVHEGCILLHSDSSSSQAVSEICIRRDNIPIYCPSLWIVTNTAFTFMKWVGATLSPPISVLHMLYYLWQLWPNQKAYYVDTIIWYSVTCCV